MNGTTNTALAIDTAARAAGGSFHASQRTLARFCTEALIDAAQSSVAGMTAAERSKFVSSISTYTTWTRDLAIQTLCGWVSCVTLREWSQAFEATLRSAQQAFPFALEQLGAAL